MIAKSKHTVWYLEMTHPDHLRKSRAVRPELTVELVSPPDHSTNRRMYLEVGGPWAWEERRIWSEDQWRAYSGRTDIETYLALIRGKEAGYAEIRVNLPQEVQLEYFGLLNNFTGKGYGGLFLSKIVDIAWQLHPQRVWLHTCSQDGPAALPNYLSRGFIIFDKKVFLPGDEIVE